MQIETRLVEFLVEYARNSRTHSQEQVSLLAARILDFGWTNPILADNKGIVAGHGRKMAAVQLYEAGHTLKYPDGSPIPPGCVPVIDCSGWTDAQRQAYIIWDNRSAELAGWSLEMLRIELDAIIESGMDPLDIGFSPEDLEKMFPDIAPQETGKDPDALPDPPPEPYSKPGDVWVCGPHRIMCGDATVMTHWDQLLGEEKVDMVWSDPPYNVAYESKLAGKIKNDDMGDADFRELLDGAFKVMFAVMKPGAAIYIAHADTEGFNFRGAFIGAGFKLSGCLIWKKDSLVLGRSDWQWIHEPILYGWKPGSKHRWYGGRKNVTVQDFGGGAPFVQQEDGTWAITIGDQVLVVSGDAKVNEMPTTMLYHEKPKRSELHPTTKPVGLIEKMLKNNARPGDIVADSFGGSGSTMIAAERMGMCARLMELDPKFTDVQAQRYFDYTGRVPVHGVTGEMFPVKRSA